jgi:hypothetical protein
MSSEEQIEIHKQFIKGVNARMLWACASMLISVVATGTYFGTKALDSLAETRSGLAKIEVKQYELEVKMDTVSNRQVTDRFSYKLDLQKIQSQIDQVKVKLK